MLVQYIGMVLSELSLLRLHNLHLQRLGLYPPASAQLPLQAEDILASVDQMLYP